jgi:hypothetical protein
MTGYNVRAKLEISKRDARRSVTKHPFILLRKRRAMLVADIVSSNIKVRGAGHARDLVVDNGKKATLPL